jgi:hypothetical protein
MVTPNSTSYDVINLPTELLKHVLSSWSLMVKTRLVRRENPNFETARPPQLPNSQMLPSISSVSYSLARHCYRRRDYAENVLRAAEGAYTTSLRWTSNEAWGEHALATANASGTPKSEQEKLEGTPIGATSSSCLFDMSGPKNLHETHLRQDIMLSDFLKALPPKTPWKGQPDAYIKQYDQVMEKLDRSFTARQLASFASQLGLALSSTSRKPKIAAAILSHYSDLHPPQLRRSPLVDDALPRGEWSTDFLRNLGSSRQRPT